MNADVVKVWLAQAAIYIAGGVVAAWRFLSRLGKRGTGQWS